MLGFVGAILIVYGLAHIQLKDWFWLDELVKAERRAENAVRTTAWDQRHERLGRLLVGLGVAVLLMQFIFILTGIWW